MRVFLLLIFVCLLYARVIAQPGNLLGRPHQVTVKSGSVKTMLEALDDQPEIILVYSSSGIDGERQVVLTGREKTVKEFLESVLKGQLVKPIEREGKIYLVAQPPRQRKTVRGFITDEKSGEKLPGASILILNSQSGTTSNQYGFYSLSLYPDTLRLLVSYAGYKPKMAELDLSEDRELQVALEPNEELKEVVVLSRNAQVQKPGISMGEKLPVSTIQSLPAMMGETDLMKAMQLLPGVQFGAEGSSGLLIRGGTADQTLITLDGVPVYNASHLFGFLSIFNADAVQAVTLLKGGFPASYGGRLSGILDVRMKEGDKQQWHGEGSINLLNSKLTLEGPLKKGKSSLLVSARRSYLIDAVSALVNLLDNNITSGFYFKAWFGDLNLKANFKLSEKDHLYLSSYLGNDFFENTEEYFATDNKPGAKTMNGFKWGNITGMARWNHVFNKKLFGNLTFNYSKYAFAITNRRETLDPGNYSLFDLKYTSSIRDCAVKMDLDYLPHPNHFIKAGVSYASHYFKPGLARTKNTDTSANLVFRAENRSYDGSEIDLYAEDDIRLTSRLKLNAGIHLAGFLLEGRFFTSAQPRLFMQYSLPASWSLRFSYAKMNQYVHLLTNSAIGLPTDLWVPSTRKVPPSGASHFVAGISKQHKKKWEWGMELYYKTLRNVIEYAEGASFGDAVTDWQTRVTSGKGWGYGAEWSMQKKQGKLTGMASYTYAHAWRKFESLNGGKRFPFKYDRRHSIKMALVFKPSKRFELSADWVFNSGSAISLPVATFYDIYQQQVVDIYEGRNNFRLGDYHRLDLSLKFSKQKKHYLRAWVVSVYNLYNRKNPFYVDRFFNTNLSKWSYSQFTLFPVLPSLTWQFKF